MTNDDWVPDPDKMLKSARTALRDAESRTQLAKEIAQSAANEATKAGMSESKIARTLGVNRLTVRRWLGKS